MTKDLDDRIGAFLTARNEYQDWDRGYNDAVEDSEPIIRDLQADNKSLRDALGFYGDEFNWVDMDTTVNPVRYYKAPCEKDMGKIARKALWGGDVCV